MNIWELGVLIMAVTFMVINVWNMFITTKLLGKFMPMVDKSVKLFDKMLDQANDEMDDNNI